MDLRRRILHALAGTGALLIVAGLSVGGGVAVADPGPGATAVSDTAKLHTAASDGSSSGAKSSDTKSDRTAKGRDAIRAFLAGTGTDLEAATGRPWIRHHVSSHRIVVHDTTTA